MTHNLLDAYCGPFLGQDPEPWALQTRHRLHDRYLRGLTALAAHWETREDWTMARACYERGLDVEPTWKPGCQGLQRYHERLGQSE